MCVDWTKLLVCLFIKDPLCTHTEHTARELTCRKMRLKLTFVFKSKPLCTVHTCRYISKKLSSACEDVRQSIALSKLNLMPRSRHLRREGFPRLRKHSHDRTIRDERMITELKIICTGTFLLPRFSGFPVVIKTAALFTRQNFIIMITEAT